MPHLLVAGQTGAGKSVGVSGMITSILFKARPDEVKFIFVDPKMNDMKDYEDLPHLLVPVITDPKKAANALKWAVDEMEGRYKLLSEWPGVRNIEQYNAAIRDPRSVAEVREKLGERLKADETGAISPMPYIVIVIDELADLMMTAPREIEESVARLAQKARAVGVHLVLATQRPSVDVITGTIKSTRAPSWTPWAPNRSSARGTCCISPPERRISCVCTAASSAARRRRRSAGS
jgi:S-DNA-T family DNA segregation ATPase FtsK/SpoIIIE